LLTYDLNLRSANQYRHQFKSLQCSNLSFRPFCFGIRLSLLFSITPTLSTSIPLRRATEMRPLLSSTLIPQGDERILSRTNRATTHSRCRTCGRRSPAALLPEERQPQIALADAESALTSLQIAMSAVSGLELGEICLRVSVRRTLDVPELDPKSRGQSHVVCVRLKSIVGESAPNGIVCDVVESRVSARLSARQARLVMQLDVPRGPADRVVLGKIGLTALNGLYRYR
jgi:hypothetical protein